MTSLNIVPLSGSIGAEVHDVDLTLPMEKDTVVSVREAFLQYKVLFFPRQPEITPDAQVAFAKQFGEPETDYPSFAKQVPDFPEIVYFDGAEPGGRASVWHTDTTLSASPTMAGILYMKEVPERGGDTMWSDGEAAFASLSAVLQEFLASKIALHDMFSEEYSERSGAFQPRNKKDIDFTKVSRAEHPIVREHPETGRKSLFINPLFTSHIVGLSSAESATLLNFLFAHMMRPEFIVRRHWSKGDVAFWDNRCTMHAAVDDYGEGRRLAYRVSLKGDRPSGANGAVVSKTVSLAA